MKTKLAIVLSVCSFLAMSCGPTAPSRNNQNMIGISGTFPSLNKKTDFLAKESGIQAGGQAIGLDPSLVATVVSICGTRGFMISTVTAGSFSIMVDRQEPAALLFVGAAGNNLGYLSLGNGMESIPVNMADDGVTSIDLQTLASSGTIIEPGHNPVGAEIPMTASEISSYVFSNGSLGSLVKSPDVDGDGIVDVTTGKFYRYTMRYAVNAGSFDSNNLTPTLASPIAVNTYVFEVKITDPDMNFPDTVTFAGPAGSGIESATSWLKQSFGTDGTSYCAPAISNPSIAPAGTYVVTYKTKTLTFNVPSQVEITKYLAIPVPTAILNSDSTLNKIVLEYRLSDGSTNIDPKALILDLNLQVTGDYATGGPAARSYNSPNVTSDIIEFPIPNQPVPIYWRNVTGIGTGYHDVFGNQIGILWSKP
jgi:hypothetical protein